jgi:hypothetical protein
MKFKLLLILIVILFPACALSSAPTNNPLPSKIPEVTITFTQPHQTNSPSPSPILPSQTAAPIITITLSVTQTPRPSATPNPEDWQTWPVIPILTQHSVEIYLRGQTLGNNPRAFSKLGDCETDTDWYLTNFDKSQAYYNLGAYEEELSQVIQYFKGSFKRDSQAAQDGASAATLLNPMWANPDLCKSGETPLDCEVRLHKPSFVIIAVGTNDTVRLNRFEGNMRRVIERLIELGVVPILGTKADNLEGDNSINLTLARLATEYDIPLWNFWLAVQPLPNHGLLEDGAHLTWARIDFSDPSNLEKAWPIRNLTALQLLDAMRIGVLDLNN